MTPLSFCDKRRKEVSPSSFFVYFDEKLISNITLLFFLELLSTLNICFVFASNISLNCFFLLSQDTFKIKKLANKKRIYNTVNITLKLYIHLSINFSSQQPKIIFFSYKAKKWTQPIPSHQYFIFFHKLPYKNN